MSKWGIILLVVLFSVIIRLWNINLMGQTWDEGSQAIKGHEYIELIERKDFNNFLWYQNPDHPLLPKYIYGFFLPFDKARGNTFFTYMDTNLSYDWTSTRFISILFGSFSVIFIILLGWKYINPLVGIVSGIIFITLPVFVGLSQLTSIESFLMFFFTANVYFLTKYLESQTIKNACVFGLFLGFALSVKFTNVLLFILSLLAGFIFMLVTKKRIIIHHIIIVLLIGFLVVFFLWPMPWFHIDEVLSYQFEKRIHNTQYSIPEVFFGKLILVPKAYYVIYFLITTPLAVIILFLIGLLSISKAIQQAVRRKSTYADFKTALRVFFLIEYIWSKQTKDNKKILFYIILMLWFSIPFLQSFYNLRQHGVRYIIEIYAPLSLLAAIGFDAIVRKYHLSTKQVCLSIFVLIMYLFIILYRISPYYLDYFNSLVGGTNGVYKKELFQMGWWGQGLREAGLFIYKDAKKPVKVGLAVAPQASMPMNKNLLYETYNNKNNYDYVVVSYFHKVRHGFLDHDIKQKYIKIYSVKADEAELVIVYKSQK